MNKKFDAKQLTLLGLMTALLLLMSFTPLGYLNIGRSPSRSTLSRSPCPHWPSDL